MYMQQKRLLVHSSYVMRDVPKPEEEAFRPSSASLDLTFRLDAERGLPTYVLSSSQSGEVTQPPTQRYVESVYALMKLYSARTLTVTVDEHLLSEEPTCGS